MDPVRAGAIQTLYLQVRNSAGAAAIVTLYMVATAWPFSPHERVLGWLAVQLSTQVMREGLLRAYREAAPSAEALPFWALAYTGYMALAGLLWGSTILLFAQPEAPITVALTLCGLYGIASGSVPGNAYNPPGLYAFVSLIFGTVLVRLLAIGTFDYAILGIASAGFALIMILFCRVQARTVREGFQIRFENTALLGQLVIEKAEAEEARHAAELASLAKSQFLAAASHDLRQPLYALSLFSASLETLALDADGRGVVSKIQDNLCALETLFDGLLDISKLEAGVIEPKRAPVDVAALFDRLSQYFHPLALDRGLDLRFRGGDDWAWTDPVLAEQILANLIANALRYTKAGGVLVAVRRRGGALRFEVCDTGIGIAAADLSRIFDEFVQIDNAERDRRRGLGLGLSIVRRAVALLEDRIDVRSRPGRGSCFSFSQPLTQRLAIARPAEQLGGFPPSITQPVLIIDNDPDVRAGLSDLLNRWNVAYDLVCDGPEALARIANGGKYALVLADYRLSGETDGLALLAAIEQAHPIPTPRRALVTGDVDPDLLARAARQAIQVLHKPLRPERLRSMIYNVADPSES